MKKLFLLSAVLFCAGLVSAQVVISNPDFEDSDFTTEEHQDSPGNFRIPDNSFPGWDMSWTNLWNVYPQILEYDAVGNANDLIDDDNFYFARLRRYERGGWGDGSLFQQVTVEPGETYVFSMIYETNTGTDVRAKSDGWKPTIDRFVRFYADSDKKNMIDEDYLTQEDPEFDLNTYNEWTKYSREVTASDDSDILVILIGINNAGGNDAEGGTGENNDIYFSFDNVSLVKKGSNSVSNIENPNLKVYISDSNLWIRGNETQEEVTIYTISGIQLYSGIAEVGSTKIPVANYAPGIYIVKVGGSSCKVIK